MMPILFVTRDSPLIGSAFARCPVSFVYPKARVYIIGPFHRKKCQRST